LDRLPFWLKSDYARDFRTADEGYYAGQVAATTQNRKTHWCADKTQQKSKVVGSEKLLPRLAQMFDGWRKADPPTTKQLPVEADVPELLAERGRKGNAKPLDQAIGDLTLIAFYYL